MRNGFFIAIALIVGIFLGNFFQEKTPWEFSSEDENEEIALVHIDEHGHHEENVVEISQDQIEAAHIEVKEAKSGLLDVILSTRGKIVLHPDRLVHVLPKVSGVAKEALKNIGDSVQKNDIVAIIESREMADLKANYLAAIQKEKLAASLFEREERLHKKKISAEQDYLNAKSAYEEAKINVQLGSQKLHAFGLDEAEIADLTKQNYPELRIYDIRSPIDGIILNRHITQGEFVETTTTIYEIADLSKVWVEIGIYPKDILKVKKGQTVTIKLPGDKKQAEANIIYVSPIIQDETITSKAVSELENPHTEWQPGTFVQVDVDTDNIAVPLLISKESLQEIDGDSVIFIKIPEGFEKRSVETGRSDNQSVEILSGLKLGEKYAATQTFLLKADLGKHEAEHEH